MGKTTGRAPAAQTKKRSTAVAGATTIVTFVALLYLVELIDQLTRHALDVHGIRPQRLDGLWGILFARCCTSWQHLMANTVPLLVLGFLMTLAGLARLVWATVIIWIVGVSAPG